jgi:serine/threonine protein kinase
MGEVYKATDSRLGRAVAIKVLGLTFANRADARERFEREARAISNLNHPHICTVHDVGQQDGTDYLVMEYLEGQTMAAALERGPIRLDDAVNIAIQVGDALDKAHRQGVVHRDLKPANVMLTKNGAKLLDFGLAKLRAPEAPVSVSVTALPTDAQNLTAAGTILGTLQYMAPEQLEGKEADARTDVFAFGATLYEMLTGRKAFNGKTQVSLMASILEHDPPPMTSIQPVLPRALEKVVNGCLAKDPEERWQTVRDVVRQLKSVRERPVEDAQSSASPAATGVRRGSVFALIAASVALTLVLASAAYLYFKTDPSLPVVRFDLTPPDGATFTGVPPRLAVSPDGRYVVFAARRSGQPDQLWLRRLDSPDANPIAGTEERNSELAPQSPFWSPDSKQIAYFVQSESGGGGTSKLKKSDIAGGFVQTLAEVPSNNGGGTWNSDGVILVATAATKGIQRIPITGGVPVPVTVLSGSETAHLWPHFLPDGRHFVFQVQEPDRANWSIHVGSLDSQEHRLLVQAEYAQFAAPNFLLYPKAEALLAQTLNLKTYEVEGEAVLISTLLPTNLGNGRAAFSVSQAGVIVYSASSTDQTPQQGPRQMVWSDRAGKLGAIVGEAMSGGLRLSPDGTFSTSIEAFEHA